MQHHCSIVVARIHQWDVQPVPEQGPIPLQKSHEAGVAHPLPPPAAPRP